MQITPELASIVLAFGVDWVAYRLFLKERLTLKRFESAIIGGAASFFISSALVPFRESWTSEMTVLVGLSLLIFAAIKSK